MYAENDIRCSNESKYVLAWLSSNVDNGSGKHKERSKCLFSVMHRGHDYMTGYHELYKLMVPLELEQRCTHLKNEKKNKRN